MKKKIIPGAALVLCLVGLNASQGVEQTEWAPEPLDSFQAFKIRSTPDPIKKEPEKIVETYPVQEVPTPPVRTETRTRPYKAITAPVNVKVAHPSSAAKKYALSRVGAAQYACLLPLWNNESHWNYKALNHSSGAYGIPQALPGSKMASAGADWRTNPITQVKWGIHYVNGRYGSACGAWAFWQNHRWY